MENTLLLISLFFAGILAGEEFVVRYALAGSMAQLDQKSHIALRQSLILKLRIFVPIIFVLALLSSLILLIFGSDASDITFTIRVLGIASLFAFIILTLSRTVPINKSVLSWKPSSPPDDWKEVIGLWVKLDTARAWMAIIAFVLLLVAVKV